MTATTAQHKLISEQHDVIEGAKWTFLKVALAEAHPHGVIIGFTVRGGTHYYLLNNISIGEDGPGIIRFASMKDLMADVKSELKRKVDSFKEHFPSREANPHVCIVELTYLGQPSIYGTSVSAEEPLNSSNFRIAAKVTR